MKNYAIILIVISLVYSCGKTKEGKTPDNVFYTCSMDPQVMEKKPGKCPICKMELTKVIIDQNDKSKGISLSDEQIQLAGIQFMVAKDTGIYRQKVLNGNIVVNENGVSKMNSRVAGRIERLYVRNPGESILPGMRLYEIYSEELAAAQKEYLMALEKVRQFPESGLDYNQLLQGSKNKLLLWGMSESQIKLLEVGDGSYNVLVTIFSKQKGIVTNVAVTEGSYVMEGDPIFEIADLNSLWVEAQLYPAEIGQLSGNDPVDIRVDAFPNKIYKSHIIFAAPQLQAQSKINLIRAEIPNKDLLLKPGMQAIVMLKDISHNSIAVPINAVLQDSKGSSVWVRNKRGKFESRMVITGIESNDMVEIRSGIEVGEEVVITGVYLLNSEYIFKKGSTPMDAHDMSHM
jgi:Cu(I)/Ag(I) efflux system membrane fusion protein